jgi:fructose-1,6-bisphosphatase/inositol monophosphatase family enzyme
MTSWIEPSHTFPYLTLPKGVSHSPVLSQQLVRTKGELAVSVSDAFLKAWIGPIAESPKSITEALATLADTFNSLILAGRGLVKVSTKESPRDFVTEMDIGLEMIVRVWLNRHFPSHKIIGEEGHKAQVGAEDVVWYIDPIDGTSNFIESDSGITFQMGATKNGKPYSAVMGLPFENQVVSGHCEAPGIIGMSVTPMSDRFPFAIGAEFREHKHEEALLFNKITEELGAEKIRVKSIGINILSCIEGKSWAFYKPDLKLWDGIPPLCLLEFACPGVFEIDFYLPKSEGAVTEDNHQKCSIFGNDPVMISRLNRKHSTDCRIGTLIVTPRTNRKLRDYLTKACFESALQDEENEFEEAK